MTDNSSRSALPCDKTQKSLVADVRQFNYESQVYPLCGNTGYEPQFSASAVLAQYVNITNAFNFKDYVPYQLEKGKMRLYPEFIRYFMKAFMSKSDENRAYCCFNRTQFQAMFYGTDREVITAAKIIEQRFSRTFIQCLSPELQIEYDGWVFTREVLATRFHREICQEIDEIAIAGRDTELFLQALEGDIIPFVEFLMAFEFGELTIWHRVASVVTNFVHTEHQGIFVSKKLAKWKKMTDRSLEYRVKDLVLELQEENIWPDLKAESGTKRKRKTETETEPSKGHLPVKEKKKHKPNTQKLKRDGTPWLPLGQYLKQQKAKTKKSGVDIPKEPSEDHQARIFLESILKSNPLTQISTSEITSIP